MTDQADTQNQEIDWSLTTFEGVRKEYLRRIQMLTLQQRMEALGELSRVSDLLQNMKREPPRKDALQSAPGLPADS
ncbi:MAG: hypothetical protein LBE59_00290 [Nevskiaceae bacterium]|jgi:hypothetical protein|nr:hypothetical protein [Nevskiaceae bacterium]